VPDGRVIMGVDAALFATGAGIIRSRGEELELVHCDLVKTSDNQGLPQRLDKIFEFICDLIERFRPELLAVEDIFYSKNIRIALGLGQARGVVMLACARHRLELAEYSAREIKQALTGNGAASKEQVAYMVKELLKISGEFKTFDVSDALAAAVCASFKLKDMVLK